MFVEKFSDAVFEASISIVDTGVIISVVKYNFGGHFLFTIVDWFGI